MKHLKMETLWNLHPLLKGRSELLSEAGICDRCYLKGMEVNILIWVCRQECGIFLIQNLNWSYGMTCFINLFGFFPLSFLLLVFWVCTVQNYTSEKLYGANTTVFNFKWSPWSCLCLCRWGKHCLLVFISARSGLCKRHGYSLAFCFSSFLQLTKTTLLDKLI